MNHGLFSGLNKALSRQGMYKNTLPMGEAPAKIKLSQGIVLNGSNQYLQAPLNAVAFPTDGTFLCRYKFNTINLSGKYPTFFNSCEDTATKNWFTFYVDANTDTSGLLQLVLRMHDNSSVQIAITGVSSDGRAQKLPKDLLYHTAAGRYQQVGTDTVMSLHVDGGLLKSASTTTSSRPASFFTNSYIGRDRAQVGRFFPGIIDELIFIPEALSDIDIKNYHKGKVPANNKLFWYKFNKDILDYSGNGYNLTAFNKPGFANIKRK